MGEIDDIHALIVARREEKMPIRAQSRCRSGCAAHASQLHFPIGIESTVGRKGDEVAGGDRHDNAQALGGLNQHRRSALYRRARVGRPHQASVGGANCAEAAAGGDGEDDVAILRGVHQGDRRRHRAFQNAAMPILGAVFGHRCNKWSD